MSNESYITNRPFEATNKKPYIFISYKHDDWREVYPIIGRFHDAGYNVWYDAALTKGQNYDIEIANKIKNSDLFITFLSELVMEKANDQDDYLVKELSVAIKKKRPRLFIYLESVGSDDLDGYYLMNCNGIQAIFKNHYPDNEEMFIDECLTTFKYHFKMEPNAVEDDSHVEELEIDEIQDEDEEVHVEKVTSKPSMSRMDALSEAVNSLSEVYLSYEDAVNKIVENVYGLYEDNARRYLADAYGFKPEHAFADSEYLYMKYGTSGNSFDDRLNNLKSEKPKIRTEVINRIKGLNSIGYEIVDENDERNAVTEFSASEEIDLAKYNHYVWCRDRISNNDEYGYEGVGAEYLTGVVLGSIRSDMDVISPYRDSLVLWDDLSNYEQEENIDFINRIFKYLPSDLKIVKLKIIRPKSHLKDLINSGVKEMVLDCDIIFDENNRNDIKIFDDDLIIDGKGHTIDADGKSRIFTIRGKNITVKNLTFKNGLTDRNGGAVFIHQKGSCSFSNCHFINNISNGGILKVKTEGGAIYNEGSCSLDACVFKQNNICGEHSSSKDIAPFESFELNDCTFEKAEDVSEPSNQTKLADGLETTNSGNAPLKGEVKNHDETGDVVGLEYSFRDPGSSIYKLAEKYFYVTRGNVSLDFSKLSDEDYARDELNIIRAICIVKAAGGVIIPSNKCKEFIDFNKLRHFKTIDKGLELYASKMRELGWKDGIYNFKNKTCSLSFSGWASDKEEEISIRILDNIEKVGYSFCKLDDWADIPVLQVVNKPADENQTDKSDFEIKEKPLPKPYEGDEPYIFVSYKHADSEIVFPLIRQLSDAGFNVWYDNGIKAGLDYDIQIANHIKNASLFVPMLTENMMSSSHDAEDYAVKELAVAIRLKVHYLPIYLEDVALEGVYLLNYAGKPSIFKHEYDDENMFIESCISTLKEELDSGADDDNQSNESEGFKTPNKLPPRAYDGNDSYIYVSYAHSDADVVFPDIERFISQGFNVWYDEGLASGSERPDQIVERLLNSSLQVVFLSDNAVESRNVKDEILLAMDQSIPILPIYIEETKLKPGLRLRLGAIQSIYRHSMPEEKYVSQCLDAFKGFGLEPKAGQKQDKHNFKYLDSLIKNNSEIVLDSDISFDDVGYERGIEIKNDVVIDGADHTIDAKGNARIFNISANNVTIKNINFENGFAESGGALIINQMANADVDSCNFKNNHAKEDGGAILNGGTVKISNSKFITNSSKNRGGAIKNWKDSVMEISTCEFNENNGLDGAAISNRGRLNISSTRFSQNEAVDSAGAVVNFKDCRISECDFSNNRSNGTTEVNGGGALFNYRGSLEVAYSKFEDNHSILGGGAIFNQDGQLLIDSSDFRRNASDGQGNSIANTEKASIMINKSQFDETQSNEIFSQGKMQLKGCKFKEEEKIKKASKKDVFISYSTKDAQIANDVCNALESNGVACWIAPRDISTGPNYIEQILDGIKNSSKFLVIYSRDYSKSSFAKQELDTAFQLNKQLIPFNIDGSDIDGECRFFLSNVQWIDGRKDSDYSSLVNVLNGNPAPKSEPKKKGLRSRLFGR